MKISDLIKEQKELSDEILKTVAAIETYNDAIKLAQNKRAISQDPAEIQEMTTAIEEMSDIVGELSEHLGDCKTDLDLNKAAQQGVRREAEESMNRMHLLATSVSMVGDALKGTPLEKYGTLMKSSIATVQSFTQAQKLLNTAMKANPFGAVITVITTLISVYGLVKQAISAFSGSEETAAENARILKREEDKLAGANESLSSKLADVDHQLRMENITMEEAIKKKNTILRIEKKVNEAYIEEYKAKKKAAEAEGDDELAEKYGNIIKGRLKLAEKYNQQQSVLDEQAHSEEKRREEEKRAAAEKAAQDASSRRAKANQDAENERQRAEQEKNDAIALEQEKVNGIAQVRNESVKGYYDVSAALEAEKAALEASSEKDEIKAAKLEVVNKAIQDNKTAYAEYLTTLGPVVSEYEQLTTAIDEYNKIIEESPEFAEGARTAIKQLQTQLQELREKTLGDQTADKRSVLSMFGLGDIKDVDKYFAELQGKFDSAMGIMNSNLSEPEKQKSLLEMLGFKIDSYETELANLQKLQMQLANLLANPPRADASQEDIEKYKKNISDLKDEIKQQTAEVEVAKKVEEEQHKKRMDFDKADKLAMSVSHNLQKALSSDALKDNKTAQAALKGIKIAETAYETGKGAMSAYQSMAGIPYVGPALGAVAAASVVAMGAAQIASIKSDSVSSGSSSTTAVAAPSYSMPAEVTALTQNAQGNISGSIDQSSASQPVLVVESLNEVQDHMTQVKSTSTL